jgi:xanthine dehydrogenase YagR molybdenum-binding subunit
VSAAHLGRPVSRVDGHAKVTGQARYAAEYPAPGLVHGHVVNSTVARGRIDEIDTGAARAVPGVLEVFTYANRPRLPWLDGRYRDALAPPGSPFRPLYDDEIEFGGQPIALVVAETPEIARYAAALVHAEYVTWPHATDLESRRRAAHEPLHRFPPPPPRGDAARAFAAAAIRVDAEYRVPVEHHHPLEPFAATVVWHGDGTLTVYDKTQGVLAVQEYLCRVFGYTKETLRVVSPYVGGAFGSGLRPHHHVFLAVLAARALGRSVRVTLTRQQMVTFGHRPATWQRVQLGADTGGRLQALVHEAVAETSRFEDFTETVVNWSGLLYRCDNVAFDHRLVPLDVFTPMDMRAPGASWGVYALECALDELAVQLGIDPIELRLRNYAEADQTTGRPFSSKELRACYRQGAERFGWIRRDPRPRSMRDGDALVGWGMAGGVWEAMQEPATARAVLTSDGTLTVSAATADIGTGTFTIMSQIAAETLGLPIEAVTVRLGDSRLPPAPIEGGSWTAASVGSAVKAVCEQVRERVAALARRLDGGPAADDLPPPDVLKLAGVPLIEAEATAEPSPRREQYALYSHSAVFAEVKVDEALGTVRVTRVVSAVAGGRVLNPKTARSQILGGIVGGIGMALQEESVLDHALGRFVTRHLADYHIAVNADVPDIEVIFVDEPDEIVNPLGAKGLGEIGIVGVAAAIANAIHHATGRRVRDLPITLDKLL